MKRLETSLRRFGYPYKILGLGETWYGGDDILHNPGAGQKVNILRTELESIIVDVGASTMADIGKVMGKAMASLKGKADGSLISKLVKDLLS